MSEPLAWAAGFFDGEGAFTCTVNGGTQRSVKDYPGTPRFQAQIGQSYSPETLWRFRAAVGVGNVTGPYGSTLERMGRYRWQYAVTKFEDAQQVVCSLWPWLSTPKRQQAADALTRHREYWRTHGNLNKAEVTCDCGVTVRGRGALASHRRFKHPQAVML